MKKTSAKTLLEAIAFEKLKEAKMPLKNLGQRNATIDEVKKYIIEAYKKAKKENKKDKKEMGFDPTELEGGWGDAEIMNALEWMKQLDIKEFFDRKKSKK